MAGCHEEAEDQHVWEHKGGVYVNTEASEQKAGEGYNSGSGTTEQKWTE